MTAHRAGFTDRVTTIEAGCSGKHFWSDLWLFRELFATLAWRDVAVRYKQTVMGVLWAVLRPLLTMVVFTIIFGKLADLPSEGDAPYAIMVYAGMLPWFVFSGVLNQASNSLVINAPLINKVHFPRLIIPVAAAGVILIDFLISFVCLGVLMLWYGFMPGWQIIFLPFFTLLAVAASLGPSLWLAALNVKYRDFKFIVPFMVQLGLYISPVGFSSSLVGEEWRLLFSLNPVVGIIDGFRWCLLGGETGIYLPSLVFSLLFVVLSFWYGLRYFRAAENRLADFM